MATVSTNGKISSLSSPQSNGKERSALETGLPIEPLNTLAELESWRKEVNRPIYHVHKWWANRLGSVFRALILAGNTPASTDLWREFYRKGHNFRDCLVLDPFMGSGTTVGEALKLGCRVVGCDINPVAYFQVKKALEYCDERSLKAGFERLADRVVPRIRRFYRSCYQGIESDILYTFWVKVLECPDCRDESRLFNKWIFSSNAAIGRKPDARAICPKCGEVLVIHHAAKTAECPDCGARFNPQEGPADGQHFTCEHCGARHRILEVARRLSHPPAHRMYALMLLLPDGSKIYKRAGQEDRELYQQAAEELGAVELPFPKVEIPPGYNTNQARNYNYHYWHQMFNDRQLYTLSTMLQGICEEPDGNVRECLLLLFSGVLEFNNIFCSFKGEGTGAVRHLFSHHILKPERTPLEANPWGTEKSSGSFATLFERRLLAAKRYCTDPFELRVTFQDGKLKGEKVFGLNRPLRPVIAVSFEELAAGRADALIIAGDSSSLPLPTASVDLVVTDPPYFDNVHYSELADFFYCWLRLGLNGSDPAFVSSSSRSDLEVQGRDASEFAILLGRVFVECARVLKPGGLLAFTFHHSRSEAWLAVASAIEEARFEVVAAHPVKAEMSVATPKAQASEPINLDLVIVCRHREAAREAFDQTTLPVLAREATASIARYNRSGTRLSRGDVRVILMGAFLKAHSRSPAADARTLLGRLEVEIEAAYTAQQPLTAPPNGATREGLPSDEAQLVLVGV